LELGRELDHSLRNLLIHKVDDTVLSCAVAFFDSSVHDVVLPNFAKRFVDDRSFNHLATQIEVLLACSLRDFLKLLFVVGEVQLNRGIFILSANLQISTDFLFKDVLASTFDVLK